MTRLETALIEVVSILDESRLPYMLIGGLAVAQWGELPAHTRKDRLTETVVH